MFNAGEIYKTFKAGPANIENEFESCKAAEEISKSARKAIVLMAHLHVILILNGSEQLTEAEKLDAKQSEVPKPVKEQINMLATRAAEAKAAAAVVPSTKKRRLGKSKSKP